MTHPTQEDDVKANDIACLRINYDVEGWRKLTKGFTLPTVLPGAILAIDSLCDEVEQLRARLEQAERRHSDLVAVLVPVVEIIRNLDDKGPHGEGWQSWQLETGIKAIDAHIAAIASEVKT